MERLYSGAHCHALGDGYGRALDNLLPLKKAQPSSGPMLVVVEQLHWCFCCCWAVSLCRLSVCLPDDDAVVTADEGG